MVSVDDKYVCCYSLLVLLYSVEATCSLCDTVFYTNLPRKTCFGCKPHPRIPSIGLLLEEYARLKSYSKVAERFGVYRPVVVSYVHNYGVPQVCTARERTDPVLLDLDWLDGWLLGDGSLGLSTRSGQKNARAGHSSAYREYCGYVVSQWARMGISSGRIAEGFNPDWECVSYHVPSRAYPALTVQYRRWYPDGGKYVPVDVRVSPVSLREWYLGDGSYHKGSGSPQLVMGNVSEQEVDFMLGKLENVFGPGISKFKGTPSLYEGKIRRPVWYLWFTKKVSASFFDFIGMCPLVCYQYKWPIERRVLTSHL